MKMATFVTEEIPVPIRPGVKRVVLRSVICVEWNKRRAGGCGGRAVRERAGRSRFGFVRCRRTDVDVDDPGGEVEDVSAVIALNVYSRLRRPVASIDGQLADFGANPEVRCAADRAFRGLASGVEVIGDGLLLVLGQRHEKTRSRCGESWCERVCIGRHATGNEPVAARFARFSNTLSTIPTGSIAIGLSRRPVDTDGERDIAGQAVGQGIVGRNPQGMTGLHGRPAEPTAPGPRTGVRGVDRHAFLSDGQTALAGTVFDTPVIAAVG